MVLITWAQDTDWKYIVFNILESASYHPNISVEKLCRRVVRIVVIRGET